MFLSTLLFLFTEGRNLLFSLFSVANCTWHGWKESRIGARKALDPLLPPPPYYSCWGGAYVFGGCSGTELVAVICPWGCFN